VSVTLTVNGEPHRCAEGLTVEALLREKAYSFPLKVIFVNRQLVRKDQIVSTVLREGDVVEVVHLTGGG
jgi:thiamine biosynthesis protein ThiS